MSEFSLMPVDEFRLENFEPGQKASFLLRFDSDRPEEGVIPINVIKGFEPGITLLVMAAVHGDEYEGVMTAIRLFRRLTPEDIRGTLVIIPVANMSAYLHGTRTSGADGENLARVFPGRPDGSFTSRLAWHLRRTFIARADFLLDMHSGGTDYALPPMVGFDDRPNTEAGKRSIAAAESFGMPIIWGHPTVAPGRTISAAIEHGVPWLYTECYGGKRIRAEEQRLYEQGALRLMCHLNMLRNPHHWIEDPPSPIQYRLTGDGNLDEAAAAEHDGFFIPEVRLAERVEAGAVIGTIYNWYGEPLQTVRTKKAGLVMMLRETPKTRKGDGLYVVADIRTDGHGENVAEL